MPNILRTLPDGLIIRHATPADAAPLAEFNSIMHSDDGPTQPDKNIHAWTMDLLTQPHPHFQPGDFLIVEDQGKIVSALCTVSQTWMYEGVPFGVGRPELVATHPDYRRRGLIRMQMDIVHQWSQERGEIMQVITGIPWYYKQFGYEMALDLSGGRTAFVPHIPKLKNGQTEPFTFRPATEADIPTLMEIYAHNGTLYGLTCQRNEAMWRYELNGRSEENLVRIQVSLIETPAGEVVGYLGHPPRLWDTVLALNFMGLKPGISWLDVVPATMRFAQKVGETYAAQKENGKFEGIYFSLGREHPMYDLFPNTLPRVRPPYAWYVRIPDVTGFVRHIAPALERRLSNSPLAGYSGKLALNFYRSGTRLTFENGTITHVEAWQPGPDEEGDVRLPDLSFLRLLCGQKSFEELDAFMVDCSANNDSARALVHALFPKRPANVWGIV
ncbi:MAG: GNAT family N-acetyltransferase [Anaerolineales bacterium]|nr:GNAT family N-acetyltransferase [Anaerolineales bacterium]